MGRLGIYLIIYGIVFLICFIWFTVSSCIECKQKNALFLIERYHVNYFRCFLKALFFPITFLIILVAVISALIVYAKEYRRK